MTQSHHPALILALCTLCSSCELLFPKQAGQSLAHFPDTAPMAGELAPAFALQDLSGNELALGDLLGSKPIVIQLGSYSCPVFRYRRFDMVPLRTAYADRVHFLVIYTQEAHPLAAPNPYTHEEWVPMINRLAGVVPGPHANADVRLSQAREAQRRMQSNATFVVDDMQNTFWQAYGKAPAAAFLLDKHGRIVLRQPWVNPRELRTHIDLLLRNDPH